MTPDLYSQVVLLQDIPVLNLRRGDIGTVLEFSSSGETHGGLVLEFFDADGQTVSVSLVDASLVGPLPKKSIMQVREFIAA